MGCTHQQAGSGDLNLWEKVLTLPATNITYVVQFLASQLIAAPLDSFTLQRGTSSLQCKAGDKPRGYSQHDWNESTKGSNVTEHPRTSQCWTFLKISISQNSIDEAVQGKRLGFSSHKGQKQSSFDSIWWTNPFKTHNSSSLPKQVAEEVRYSEMLPQTPGPPSTPTPTTWTQLLVAKGSASTPLRDPQNVYM